MLVNKSTLSAIFVNLKTIFNKAFEGAPTKWEKVAMKIPSTGSRNDYGWLSEFPRMKKWVGDKVVKALKAFSYTIVNDDFEATIRVKRNDIDDDNIGIYGPQAQNAGWSAKKLPDELVFELIDKGFAERCYDGQYFFDPEHPVGKEGEEVSVSNKGTAALSVASLEAAQAGYGAARTAMRKFRDDEGRPLGIAPTILLVPPALEDTGRLLLTADKLKDEQPNPYQGTAELVVGDWLTSDTAWFLIDGSRPIRPFIYQERKAPVFVSQTDPEADNVFMRGEYLYGAEARGAVGYGLWQLAYGSTGTG